MADSVLTEVQKHALKALMKASRSINWATTWEVAVCGAPWGLSEYVDTACAYRALKALERKGLVTSWRDGNRLLWQPKEAKADA